MTNELRLHLILQIPSEVGAMEKLVREIAEIEGLIGQAVFHYSPI
jgi:hypothetical protein